MQVYVKRSVEAVNIYQKAFNAEILGLYPDGNGGYMHSELNAYGQILAVSECIVRIVPESFSNTLPHISPVRAYTVPEVIP